VITIQEKVNFWHKGARKDKKAALVMYRSKHYDWCLFMWHLVLEKILKAKIASLNKPNPFIHNLTNLTKIAGIVISKEEFDQLSEISSFNLNARYSEYKYNFYKKCTKTYADKWIKICSNYFIKFKAAL
jgi:HEPN domain-containing protein